MQDTLIIARRKRGKVRMFNTRTAKMSGWEPDPTAESSAAWRAGDAAAYVQGYTSEAEKLTVSMLRILAVKHGVRHNSKTRKADLINSLAWASYYRSGVSK